MASTIKDVARLSGLSVATISNVLTRKKYVSPEVTQKALQAMRALNYKPNMIARSLKVKKTNTIGVIVPDIGNPFFADVIKGVESLSKKSGYQIFLFSTNGDAISEEGALNGFLSQNVDGVINIAPRMPDEKLLSYISVPHIVADRPIDVSDNLGCVCADNVTGCRQLARHFIDSGHRRFACFTGPLQNVPNARARLDGFCGELLRGGFPMEDIVVHSGEFSFESGHALMARLLAEKALPTAVFVSSDIMAWGALECARLHGLAVPRDVAIAGYDNVYFSSLVSPALTTIDHPKFEIGFRAFQILQHLMSGKRGADCRVQLETALVVRASTSIRRGEAAAPAGRRRRNDGSRAAGRRAP